MTFAKSLVLLSTFPSSKTGINALQAAIEYVKPYDFSMLEYYCENCNADQVNRLLGDYQSIYLAAALQKAEGLNPSSIVKKDRKRAVDLLTECFLFAQQTGAQSVLINSGQRPDNEKDDAECLSYLADSICELHHRVKDIKILLEPGDRDVQYNHLIGHTDVAVSFIEDLRDEVPCIGLVFDISHIAQLNEDLYTSWELAKKYCYHVHLANCVLDRNSPLYGDRHPLFSVESGVYSHKAAQEFYNYIQNEETPPSIGIEMICPEESEESFFKRFSSETEWFFVRK